MHTVDSCRVMLFVTHNTHQAIRTPLAGCRVVIDHIQYIPIRMHSVGRLVGWLVGCVLMCITCRFADILERSDIW